MLRGGAPLYEWKGKLEMAFVKDENNLKLKEVFKNNIKLKDIHIDAYPENPLVTSSEPFMLLLRTIEKNITVENDGDRLVLKKSDGFATYIMNVLFSKITESYYKSSGSYFEFILNIQNIYYKITVFN